MTDLATLPAHDLLVGADGANSLVRRAHETLFQPTVDYGRNKYIWLGTRKLFHGLTLTFVEHPTGVYAAHSYKFDGATQHLHRRMQRSDLARGRARRDERVADVRLP